MPRAPAPAPSRGRPARRGAGSAGAVGELDAAAPVATRAMIEFELQWYLIGLPVAVRAPAGWLRGFDARAAAARQRAARRARYFRGLNLLLNEQHGQGDRRLHRGGQARPGDDRAALRARQPVPPARRVRPRGAHPHAPAQPRRPAGRASAPQALAELAQDYLKGGLLDRAEEAFTRLLDEPRHRFEALRALLRIYQMEREWLQGDRHARAGSSARPARRSHAQVAHFHCELAEQRARRRGRIEDAQRHLERGADGQPQVGARH
ncbi:MAG: hypothetical protein MZW92_25395 [Comamonadaceae bacterium]|nr:hypothetical protein [Comamonadaceae bacterium]